MFRCGLLVTTALVIAGSFSFLAAQSAVMAGPVKAGVARDRNKEFMHTYGAGRGWPCGEKHFVVSTYDQNFSSGSSESAWTHVAVPITGHGNTVDRIVVREGYSSEFDALFSAGIHSNTPSGVPGKLIAGGTGKARPFCGKVRVNIPPTKLSRNTIYWIEETTPGYANPSKTAVYWKVDPHRKSHAYSQAHFYHWSHSSGGSYTSPWGELTEAPYFRLK